MICYSGNGERIAAALLVDERVKTADRPQYAVKLALEKAGVNDASMSASDICDKVKVAMTEITLDGVTGSTTWTADGEPTKAPQVMKITVTDGVGSYVSAQ